MEREPRDGMEPVGNFRMCVTIGSTTQDGEERWARRTETLTNWLLAAWRREQAQVEELVPDGQRRSDGDGHFRRCDLN